MKIILGLEQNTKEWLEFRRNHIGASDAATIMGLNPWRSALALWEEKTMGSEQECNTNMRRGQKLEPLAREAYMMETGLIVEPIVAECEIRPFLSASFDGVTKCLSHAVEIKCGASSHKLALMDEVPIYYYAQLQHQMYIGGFLGMHYYSFDGKDGILIEMDRDEDFIDEMLEKEIAFWNCVTQFTPPEVDNETIRSF
jgi:putative phage-type endonuclease